MALINCPNCRAQVSDIADACPRCGFPVRHNAPARPARFGRGLSRRTSSTGTIIAVTVVVVLVFLAVLPTRRRRITPAQHAREVEGESMLRLAFTFEKAYHRDNGRYTPSFEELRSVGWQQPPASRFYTVEIAFADSSDLCLHARPRAGSGVRPFRMQASGRVDRGRSCDERTTGEDRATADARGVLRDVYGGVAAWRREHGRLPQTEAELVEAYPSAADDPDFAMGLTPVASGGLCMRIAPRTQPPSPVALSLDGGGNVYEGDGCGGRPVQKLGQ